MKINPTGIHSRPKAWLQRFGLAGFTFFFLKGLAWLSLPLITRVLLS